MSKEAEKGRGQARRGDRAKQHLPDALLASLNLLGPLGSVFATALTGYFTTKRLANIECVLEVMGERLKSLESSKVEAYMCSDEFIQLFLTTIQKAQIEHQQEKRMRYGLMLANMGGNTETPYDVKSMFISFLSEIELVHLRVLSYLRHRHEQEVEGAKWADIDTIRLDVSELSNCSSYVTIAVLQKLANSGMLMSKGHNTKLTRGVNPVGLWFHSLFAITELGVEFMSFLKE